MTMFIGLWKAVKEVAIAIMLVLSLWLVISSAMKKDIGNLTDWISSLSSLGTLIVAYLAFKSAPNWFHQKMDEHAFTLAKELITDLHPKLFMSNRKFNTIIEDYTTYYYHTNADDAYNDFISTLYEKKISYRQNHDLMFKIKTTVDSLEKLGWNFKSNIFSYHKKYLRDSIQFISSLRKIDNEMKEIKELSSTATSDEDYNKIESKKRDFFENLKALVMLDECDKSYKQFIGSAKLVPDYFEITTIKTKH
ncbi:hypothetical protein [Klebsiella sp. 141240]|uniref:hypothetical protein n=1 Tax=Klebsiella sp. 141240 TaxID=3020034 RepID=UPI003D32E391